MDRCPWRFFYYVEEEKIMTEEIMSTISGEVFGVWFLIGAALVFWMQAGFAMVEAGFTRAKNTGNILMKNLMDFCIGTVMFILIGFSLLLGEDMVGLIGKPGFDIFTNYAEFDWSNFIFNLVFCATTATIVSGAMAERTKFISYCVYSAVISAVIYPIEAHWIWGGGWLSQIGFHDFAGSCAIHMVGGVCALIGAAILGPRIGKFVKDKDGKVKERIIDHTKKHASWSLFCRYVLNQTQEELQMMADRQPPVTDFTFSYEGLLNGQPLPKYKRPDSIRFTIHPTAVGRKLAADTAFSAQSIQVRRMMTDIFGLTEGQARTYMRRVTPDNVGDFIRMMMQLQSDLEAGRRKAYNRTAVAVDEIKKFLSSTPASFVPVEEIPSYTDGTASLTSEASALDDYSDMETFE